MEDRIIGFAAAVAGLLMLAVLITMRQRDGRAEHFLFTQGGERYLSIIITGMGVLLAVAGVVLWATGAP
jgi:hypothetical protein